MRYPWSEFSPSQLRLLNKQETHVRALTAAGDPVIGLRSELANNTGQFYVPGYDGEEQQEKFAARMMTVSGVSRWLNSPRRIITISEESCGMLENDEPRFHSLPLVHDDQPWKHGVMFFMPQKTQFTVIEDEYDQNPVVRDMVQNVMVYMEPAVQGDHRGVSYTFWLQNFPGGWGAQGDDDTECWYTAFPLGGSSVEVLRGPTHLHSYTELDHILEDTEPQTWGVLGAERDHSGEGIVCNLRCLRRIAINALAALHEDPRITTGRRKLPQGRRNGKVGPISRVRRLTLSVDAVRLVTRRWASIPTDEPREKIEHRKHRSPCEHTVAPHEWRVWVNNPKAHEKALDIREKIGRDGKAYYQYRVKRLRGKNGKYTRGGGISPKRARMVTGVGDLSMPGDT